MQISSNTYFTYDGHESYLYGLRFAWIENSPEKVMVSEKKYNQAKNNASNSFRVVKTTYEDALEFDAEMASDRVLLDPEVRRIYRKYFDKNQFKVLSIPLDTGYGSVEPIYFNCVFTDVEKVEGGYGDRFGVVGFKVKMMCDAPWGWTDEKLITPTIPQSGDDKGVFYIRNRTDGQDYIYPEVNLSIPAGSSVTSNSITRIGNKYACLGCPLVDICINGSPNYPNYMTDEEIAQIVTVSGGIPKKGMIINQTDDQLRGTCFLCKKDFTQTFHMDPKTGIIIGKTGSTATNENKVYMTNKSFIRLVPGDNKFYTENISEITLKYREARILV